MPVLPTATSALPTATSTSTTVAPGSMTAASVSTNFPTTTAQTAPFMAATGELLYKLTNDYLFRAIFQRSNAALRGLICALLGLSPQDIISVEITNPIELGKSIDAKDFLLDVRVLLNNDTMINMEMQILNLHNFPERSLGYLCRSFDNLNKGQDYLETKSVIQVCFLDFTLFKESPEFHSNYMFMNVKNHAIYSDKLRLTVIDLTQIDLATEDDKLRGIDYWARLFKATTWEEIKMLAENNSFLQEAAATAYQLSAEEAIRLQCEAREEYYKQQRYIQKQLKKLEILEAQQAQLQRLNDENLKALTEKDNALAEKDNALAEKDNALAMRDAALAAKDAEIARLKAQLSK